METIRQPFSPSPPLYSCQRLHSLRKLAAGAFGKQMYVYYLLLLVLSNYVRVSSSFIVFLKYNMPNNPNTYLVPSHTCLGYVWVGILSLIVALLLYTPWRLSRDNYDAWQRPEANWNTCRSKSIHRWLAYAPLYLRFIDMLVDILSLKEVLSKIYFKAMFGIEHEHQMTFPASNITQPT